jgi:ACR3 family arsenite transporter
MKDCNNESKGKGIGFFERYLTVWVILCIIGGIALGKVAPNVAKSLDAMAIYVNDAPIVSIPIALCLFFMMYPIMVKIDFAEVLQAGKAFKPVGLTLFINWAIKPFTMYGISLFFLGTLFLGFIGPDEVDHVNMPLGEELSVGDPYGAGRVVEVDGQPMLEVPLWRSYLAGCILLGIAPCTAMVLVRARGGRYCCRSAFTSRYRWSRDIFRANGSSRPKAKTGSRRSSSTT